ncbi:MAG: GAF domain-containing sensor histidine kinase [Bacillota bacterium]
MPHHWSRHTWTGLYQWTVVAGGTLTVALARPRWSKEPDVLITLVLLFAIAEYFPTRVRAGAVSFDFPIAYGAFLLYGPAGAVWVTAVGTALANLARGRNWRVTWFNAAQFALSALAAARLSVFWPGPPTLHQYVLPILAYLAWYYAANNIIVDLLLWMRLRVYPMADWLAKTKLEALSAAVSYGYSLLMLILAPQHRGQDPLALIFFFLPLLTVGGFARLLANLSQYAHHMETLLEVSALITTAPDDIQALDTVLSRLNALGDYRYAAIYQMQGDELTCRALRGIPPEELAHPRIHVGEGLTGWAARNAVLAVAGEARNDPRNTLGEGVREQAHALAAMPLMNSGQVVGVLTVGKERSRSLQPEDTQPLKLFANLLAAVLHNLQTTEERKRLLLLQERNRLAREIHDGLAQSLAGAILQMDRLERLLDGSAGGAGKLLHLIREQVRASLLEVRRSIFNLRPSPLEKGGLADAFRQEIVKLQQKGLVGDTEVRLEVRGEQRPLSGMVEDEVFRVAQEGLTNALKHGEATKVSVILQFHPEWLRLTIRDNGKGFQLAEAIRVAGEKANFGLMGMNERAQRLGASFDVQSRSGQGTSLTLEVPLLGE